MGTVVNINIMQYRDIAQVIPDRRDWPIPSHPLVQTLLKRGCPTVRIGRLPHPEDDRVPAVMEDLVGVGWPTRPCR